MSDTFKYKRFTIAPIYLELEINYIVLNSVGYFCRLVPGESGLQLSKLDNAIDNRPDKNMVAEISDFIIQKDA